MTKRSVSCGTGTAIPCCLPVESCCCPPPSAKAQDNLNLMREEHMRLGFFYCILRSMPRIPNRPGHRSPYIKEDMKPRYLYWERSTKKRHRMIEKEKREAAKAAEAALAGTKATQEPSRTAITPKVSNITLKLKPNTSAKNLNFGTNQTVEF